MKVLALLALISLLAIPAAHAQVGTTGVPGINDLTVNTLGSGSTSCTTINLSCAGTLTFSVSTTPGAFVAIYGSPCKCIGCAFWLPPVACAIPFTVGPACSYNPFGGATNQSVDLPLACGIFPLFSGFADTAGNFTLAIPLPPTLCGFCFSAQAVIIDSVCAPSSLLGIMVSQAYDIII